MGGEGGGLNVYTLAGEKYSNIIYSIERIVSSGT